MVSVQDRLAKRLTLKKVLYHPLTWLAVGFHALLLTVPFDPSAPVEAEPEEAQAEEIDEAIPIDILNLSEISTDTPPVATPPEAIPPAAPPVAAPPVAAPPVVLPSELPLEEALPVEEVPVDALPVEELPVEEVPVEPPPVAYDPGQDQTLFIDNLGAMALGDYTDAQGLPPANFFREPANAGYFLDGEAPVAGARDARWMDKGPDAVLTELQSTYESSGITFTQLDSYGGEELYELNTATGESFMFVSLARLKGSSLLVIWQSNPLL